MSDQRINVADLLDNVHGRTKAWPTMYPVEVATILSLVKAAEAAQAFLETGDDLEMSSLAWRLSSFDFGERP